MKKGIAIVITVLLMCLGVIGNGVCAADKVVTLEASTFISATDPLYTLFQEWSDEVGKRTNGRIKVNLHPGGTMVPPAQTFDSVVNKIIDVGHAGTNVNPGRFPVLQVMDLPLHHTSAYAASTLAMELVKSFKPKEFSSVKVLFMLSGPPNYIMTKKPIRTLEQLKGTKLRVLGPAQVDFAKALGAVPVVIGPTDVYDALSKGVAEGVISDVVALYTFKFGDILKNITELGENSLLMTGFIVMNLDRWNSLPPDVKQIIDKLSLEYMEKISKLWDKRKQEAYDRAKSEGYTFIKLSNEEQAKWTKSVAPILDQYVKSVSEKGVPGADVLKFCQDWIKKNQK